MIIYVETNFVLELALLQEQSASCEKILSICEAGQAHLVIPAFCLAEPFETLGRREKDRSELIRRLTNELVQLSRSKPYQEEVEALQNITGLLAQSNEEERQRLNQTLDKMLEVAEIIPLEREILVSAAEFQANLDLSPQDSIVYASVLHHLNTAGRTTKKCFLNRNSRDFDDPDIIETLNTYDCKMLFKFDSGYSYIESQIGSTTES